MFPHILRACLLVTLIVLPGALHAQTIRELLTNGNAELEGKPLDYVLEHYETALRSDSSAYDAAWKASLAAVTLAESGGGRRDSLLAEGIRYGRRAVAIDPAAAEGHFCLAQALGRKALTLQNPRDRAKFAVEIRAEALAALAITPQHAGAKHVLGLWHQNIMELSAIERLMAKTIPGTDYIAEASWEDAERYLEAAVELAPDRFIHRLDLGRLYVLRKQPEKALEQFRWILANPSTDYNDDWYRRYAEAEVNKLGQVP